MKIRRYIYFKIVNSCPAVPPESGGILGGKSDIITVFASDIGIAGNGYDEYIPNTEKLNQIISDWNEIGIEFFGIYHSHFPGGEELSNADKKYIAKIMEAVAEFKNELYFPLVFPGKKIIVYKAKFDGNEVSFIKDDVNLI